MSNFSFNDKNAKKRCHINV